MNKETIFRHELNESIQANAALNCLKNRNNHKQINEVAPVVAAAGRMLLPMLRPVITKLVQKALVKIGTHARPTEVLKLVMGMLTKGEFAKKMAEKCGQTWNEIPSNVKKEIQNAIIDAFKAQSPQEQEEHPEDADRLQSQLANAWDEGMEDDEDDYVPYNNTFDETHHDIVENLISIVEYYFNIDDDVSGFYQYDYTEDQLGKAVEKVLDKYGDFPSSNSFNKCYAWVKKHAEEIIKVLETGSLENTYEGHPEFDFSEQEELP